MPPASAGLAMFPCRETSPCDPWHPWKEEQGMDERASPEADLCRLEAGLPCTEAGLEERAVARFLLRPGEEAGEQEEARSFTCDLALFRFLFSWGDLQRSGGGAEEQKAQAGGRSTASQSRMAELRRTAIETRWHPLP